jgi:SNW domain-containing protein 1
MSLLASLPAPKRDLAAEAPPAPPAAAAAAPPAAAAGRGPPPYGARAGFVPRRPEDFGGGGAFPEVHVAQYPLDMGRPDRRGGAAGGAGGIASGAGGARAGQTLALTVTADGDVSYDAIARRGANANKTIATGHAALVPKLEQLNAPMPRPGEEEAAETALATAAALNKRLERKAAAVDPLAVPSAPGAPQYVKYTPAGAGAAHASGAAARVVKVQDMPVDPLEPPKFRHTKAPRGAGSPPVPVMHSPPRALTAADQRDWKIPPCVSNWKNAKGYTIPLDKRLAADGRGLQESAINDGFAKFTEALYVAEHKARAAVEARSRMQRELLAREKDRKEVELRELATRARMDRMGGGAGPAAPLNARGEGRAAAGPLPPPAGPPPEAAGMPPPPPESDEERELPREHRTREERGGGGGKRASDRDREGGAGGGSADEREPETREEREARRARDELREERRHERERERRLEAREAHGFKRSKLTRDRERDVSEKVALGQAKVGGGGEAMYDQRLFNQEAAGAGLGAGLADEEAYNLYDQPLFADRADVFRARGGRDAEAHGGGGSAPEVDTARFRPDKGFAGADGGKAAAGAAGGGGGGPVQFERDPAEADPFGLDAFLSDVKAGKKRERGPLDGVGRGGGMAAAAGGAGRGAEDYAGGGSGRRMDFRPAEGADKR